MHTVLVTPELAHASAPGDLGAFAWHWSRLLRQSGDAVRVILTRPPLRPSRDWRQVYDELGIAVDVLEEPERFIALPHGYRWSRRMAEVVWEHMPPGTEIVYYAERDANGMHHLRRRRFTGRRLPVVATVLHGGSAWQMEQARRWPQRLEDVEQDFFERYVVAHSDWVIAPSQAMLGWVERAGWALPPAERIRVAEPPFVPEEVSAAGRASGTSIGEPPADGGWRAANERWLALHQEIAAQAREAAAPPASAAPPSARDAAPDNARDTAIAAATDDVTGKAAAGRAVDVCIPYFNLGAYLPALLEALDQQTTQDFNVFVVNDGSSDPQAVAVFEQMTQRYADHTHWRFITTANQGVCAARNLAASLGTAEYLCFVDADNLPLPNMIERFLSGIRQSGDDVLTCYLYVFTHKGAYRPIPGLTAPAVHYLPTGNCQPLGLFTNPFGDINCIIRRAAFEAVDGFTDDTSHDINHEDRELFTRLSFAGYRLDVVPEFLCFYRERAGGRLHTTDAYLNDARVLRVYTEELKQVGLAGLAPLALGMARERDANADVPGQPVSLHYLVFRVSTRLYLKALPHKLRRLVASRLGRLHQPQ